MNDYVKYMYLRQIDSISVEDAVVQILIVGAIVSNHILFSCRIRRLPDSAKQPDAKQR